MGLLIHCLIVAQAVLWEFRVWSLFRCAVLSVVSQAFNTTFTNFSSNYLVMCKAYTDVGGVK